MASHRMAEARRDLWRSPGATLCSSRATPELLAQHHILAAFEDLQGGDCTTSGQPLPGLGQPQSEVPPDVKMEPPAFQFVPDASHPVTRRN